MKKYAYFTLNDDGTGTLHITPHLQVAADKAYKGKYIETSVRADHGYPTDEDGNAYVVYSDGTEKNEKAVPDNVLALVGELNNLTK